MANSQKETIPAQEIGMALVRWLNISDVENHPLLKDRGQEDSQRFVNELVWLRAFAVDFAVFSVFGNTPLKAAILDAFYEQVGEGIVDPALYTQLLERLKLYEAAMKHSDPGGPGKNLEEVGLAFARACGGEPLSTSFHAGVEFAGAVGAIKDLLLGWREKYTIVQSLLTVIIYLTQ